VLRLSSLCWKGLLAGDPKALDWDIPFQQFFVIIITVWATTMAWYKDSIVFPFVKGHRTACMVGGHLNILLLISKRASRRPQLGP
jgi:hypothetical protein